jgi:exonuclease III
VTATVVSWNLNHWQRSQEQRRAAWDYLAHELQADVALVQEAGVPPSDWHQVGSEIGGSRPWGTWVVSPTHPLTQITEVRPVRVSAAQPYSTSKPGTAATATAIVDGLPLTLVSLYGLMEPRNAYESVNRHLADLGPLLDSPEHLRSILLGGDLNLTTQWAGQYASYAAIDRAILDQFRAWGFRDLVAESTSSRLDGCTCADGEDCRHRQTWWRPGDDVPRQNDHLFAANRIPGRVSLTIDESAVRSGFSDHAPLIATIDR